MTDLLTVHEAAEILRVDDATIRRWIKSGLMEAVMFPHIGIRRVFRVKRETIEKLLNGQ